MVIYDVFIQKRVRPNGWNWNLLESLAKAGSGNVHTPSETDLLIGYGGSVWKPDLKTLQIPVSLSDGYEENWVRKLLESQSSAKGKGSLFLWNRKRKLSKAVAITLCCC